MGHLVSTFAYTTLLYALLLFICAAAMGSNPSAVLLMLGGGSIVVATLHLCSFWAAIGTGSYLSRALLSLVAGAIVASAGYLGCLVGTGIGAIDFESVPQTIAVVSSIWLVGQIPYLLLALLMGWRTSDDWERVFLGRGTDQTSEARDSRELGAEVNSGGVQCTSNRFTIWDMMALTLVCAVVVAYLRIFELLQPAVLWELGPIYLVWLGIGLLVACPTVWLLLRESVVDERGTAQVTLYVVALVVLGALVLIPMGLVLLVVPFGMILCAFEVLFALPLLFARQQGLTLKTGSVNT